MKMVSIKCILLQVFSIIVLIENVNSDRHTRSIRFEWEAAHPAFDPNIYEEVLDSELCTKQIEYLTSNDPLLTATFVDSGPRIPRWILQGNLIDLGNYHQCLGIHKEVDDMVIEGKYCQMGIGLSELQKLGITELENVNEALDNIKDERNLYEKFRRNIEALNGIESKETLRTNAANLGGLRLNVAICVPKPCSIRDALLNFNRTMSIDIEEHFCRLKNDKPWSPGVYVAIVIFSLFVLLAVLSTSYDIWNTIIHKRDPKSVNTLYRSFSVYTNARRLVTFTPVRGALECVDGIRAIAMAWIVIGHTFVTLPPVLNNLDAMRWVLSFRSIWITAAPIGVDTFFMLSGLLVVYTTVGKVSNMKLLKNIHLFYFNRILRMFPLLSIAIILQVGVLHYIHDGPIWKTVATLTQECRVNWWSTLFYLQNYIRPICLPHTWYLAIDMQLHILSPLILFWVLSGKRHLAWSALIIGLLISLAASTIYNFLNNFTAVTMRPAISPEESQKYMSKYYTNTLTRCSPFFVGMCYGYLIHYWRETNIRLSKTLNLFMWIFNLSVLWLAFYGTTPMKNADFDNQTMDNLVNSFMRPAWALGLGWLILACAEGYGGPINWFLSLQIWKLPSRISYAIYLLHYPIQFVISGAAVQHVHFSLINIVYIYCGQFVIVFILSFVFTILVDSPFSTLFKMLLGGGIKKSDDNGVIKNTSKTQLVTNGENSKNLTVT